MSTKTTVSLAFNGPQLTTWQNVKRRRKLFLGWGRGVGKSYFLRTCWWLLVSQYEGRWRTDALKPFRGVRIIVLMSSLTQFKDVHLAGIENDLLPGGDFAFLNAKIDRSRGHVKFPGGSSLKAFPAASYTSRRARGMRGDVLCGDEFDDIDADVYDGVALPFLSEPWSLGIEIDAGTPTRGRHGLWYREHSEGLIAEKFRSGALSRDDALNLDSVARTVELIRSIPAEERPDDPEEFALDRLRNTFGSHATYRDAPETVSLRAVANARQNTPEATFKREWEADPDAGEGLVFGGVWDADFHVRDAPAFSTFREFHVGMDHGSTDPGVLLLAGIHGRGKEATLWLLDEWYEQDVPNHIWDKRAFEWRFAKFWPDTSRKDRVQDLRALGLEVGETDRGPGSIDAGISLLADLLFIRSIEVGNAPFTRTERYSRMYVSPKCVNTIRELGSYRYPKLPDGTFGRKPVDKDNHTIDSARYLAVGALGRPKTARTEVGGR